MKPAIKTASSVTEFETREGCWILEVANDADDPVVGIARARVLPGVTTEWHSLKETEERYLIVAGHGRMEVGQMSAADVVAGDVVLIPSGAPQRITNIGDQDLVFYCICTPPFEPSCYEARPELGGQGLREPGTAMSPRNDPRAGGR